jgi:hypothetical protein
MKEDFSLIRALLKGLAVYLLVVLLFPVLPDPGGISAYNRLLPGRSRLPFGENPAAAYNLSLYSLPAMFAAHEISAPSPGDEYRLLVIGDSSVWGTLLRPEETLSGQLNAAGVSYCGRPARFYNLGYPTISLTKDLLLLDYARRYQPDHVLWLTTLEAFPLEKQLDTPLVANNRAAVVGLIERYRLPLDPYDPALVRPTFYDRTLIGQRRALADLARLQLYGVLWAATGVDQFYPESYPPPRTDFAADDDGFHSLSTPLDEGTLAYQVLAAGIAGSPAPVLLVNEPMLISGGQNSQVRYNFFYPRWAYDAYQAQLAGLAAAEGWAYLDAWDLLPAGEFTNSAIHLTPAGVRVLAEAILAVLAPDCP